jgi:hypothetical protein
LPKEKPRRDFSGGAFVRQDRRALP